MQPAKTTVTWRVHTCSGRGRRCRIRVAWRESRRRSSPTARASCPWGRESGAPCMSIVKRLGDMTQIYSASSARVLPRQASCSGGMSASSRRTRRRCLSSLYSGFREHAHPVLAVAASVDLNDAVATIRRYSPNGNRPILHRKELLLDASDPAYARFAALTDQEERAGLFSAPTTIGRERGWARQLEERGVMIRGHRLLRVGEADASTA